MKFLTPPIIAALLALSASGHANQPTEPQPTAPKADAAKAKAKVTFPSDDSCPSPDGKWKVTSKSSEPDDSRSLLLVEIGGTSRELRSFDRSCDALWSADSSHVAITDWMASDVSDVIICPVDGAAPDISVRSVLPKGLVPDAHLEGHCYFEAIKWLDNNRLQIRISGHEDVFPGASFSDDYIFDLTTRDLAKMKPKKATRKAK